MTVNRANISLTDITRVSDYEPGMEAGIVGVLQDCFEGDWGSVDLWRWKHTHRLGFDPRQIKIFFDDSRPVACFHSAIFAIQLARGLDLPCSLEGDYAVLPQFRGYGLLERAYDQMGDCLAAGGAVLRIGFTSGELQRRVYHKKFGHTFVPTTTAQYRRILSTTLLCEKLQGSADQLRTRAFMQRILRRGELHIELRVTGFEPCHLTLASNAATCTTTSAGLPDLRIAIPYNLLTCTRNGVAAACQAYLSALLCGQVRVSRLFRFIRRLMAF